MPPLKARKFDRCSLLAVAATGLALQHAGLDLATFPRERVGIVLGCGFGGITNSVEFLSGYFRSGVEGWPPCSFPTPWPTPPPVTPPSNTASAART